MRINTKVVIDIESNAVLEREAFDYEGPLELAGGGPSVEQKQAAASQANLSNQLGSTAARQQQFFEQQQNRANPFYLSRMENGLPYYNAMTDAQSGLVAQAFAPARANLYRQLGAQSGLPSGFRQQALTDLDTQQARAFDEQMLSGLSAQEQAKQAGAAGLIGQAQVANPMGYYGGAMQGNQSIMQAPLARPGIAGVLGGIARAAMLPAGG